MVVRWVMYMPPYAFQRWTVAAEIVVIHVVGFPLYKHVLHTSCSKICTNTEVFQKISNLKFPENTLVPVPSKFISVLPGLVIDLAIFLWRTTSTKCRRLNKLLKKEKNIRPMRIIGWIVACVVVHHNRHHHHQEYTRILGRWWLYVGWLHAWWTGGTAIMWLPLVFRTCFWLICLKQLLYFGWYVWNIYFTLVDIIAIFISLWFICWKYLLYYGWSVWNVYWIIICLKHVIR